MRTNSDFNTKYKEHLETGHFGMDLEIPAVIAYVDQLFDNLTKIPGFKYEYIHTKYGLARVHTNLAEIMPLVGRIITQEMEDKINFILKVEFEVEQRLLSLNLDKNGKAFQSL